jgi:ATP-dependent Clp protease ATP-binding subunit ClpA
MYGARPVKRWLLKNVMTKLSEMLIKGEISEGSSISIDAINGKSLKYEVVNNVADRSPSANLAGGR